MEKIQKSLALRHFLLLHVLPQLYSQKKTLVTNK